jgi:hypothetical protein
MLLLIFFFFSFFFTSVRTAAIILPTLTQASLLVARAFLKWATGESYLETQPIYTQYLFWTVIIIGVATVVVLVIVKIIRYVVE